MTVRPILALRLRTLTPSDAKPFCGEALFAVRSRTPRKSEPEDLALSQDPHLLDLGVGNCQTEITCLKEASLAESLSQSSLEGTTELSKNPPDFRHRFGR